MIASHTFLGQRCDLVVDVVVVVISNPDMLAGQRALGNRGDMDNELVNTKHRIGLGQNGYSDSSPREARLEPKSAEASWPQGV